MNVKAGSDVLDEQSSRIESTYTLSNYTEDINSIQSEGKISFADGQQVKHDTFQEALPACESNHTPEQVESQKGSKGAGNYCGEIIFNGRTTAQQSCSSSSVRSLSRFIITSDTKNKKEEADLMLILTTASCLRSSSFVASETSQRFSLLPKQYNHCYGRVSFQTC